MSHLVARNDIKAVRMPSAMDFFQTLNTGSKTAPAEPCREILWVDNQSARRSDRIDLRNLAEVEIAELEVLAGAVFSLASAPEPAREASADLRAALDELDGARAEAQQEGLAEPSELAINNARALLAPIYERYPAPIEVYPEMEGDITIYVSPGPRRSVEVVCKRDGGARCQVNLDGLHRRAIYDSADMLPDGFLREALDDL